MDTIYSVFCLYSLEYDNKHVTTQHNTLINRYAQPISTAAHHKLNQMINTAVLNVMVRCLRNLNYDKLGL